MVTITAADFPPADAWYFVTVAAHPPDWELDNHAGVWFCCRVWPSGDPCTTEVPVGADLDGVLCKRRHVIPLGDHPDTP